MAKSKQPATSAFPALTPHSLSSIAQFASDTTWGLACPYGAGYGTIPYAYISRFGTEAYAPL